MSETNERPAASSGFATGDIVDQLCGWRDERGFPTPGELMDKAAAEIRRLRIAIPDSCLRSSTVEQRFCEPPVAGSTPAAGLCVHWIPVTEQLPPDGVLVLAYRKRCDYGFRRDGQWIDTLYGGALANGPTHWMPLPAPPTDAK